MFRFDVSKIHLGLYEKKMRRRFYEVLPLEDHSMKLKYLLFEFF